MASANENPASIYDSILLKCLNHPDCPQKENLREHLTSNPLEFQMFMEELSQFELEVLESLWEEIELSPEESKQINYKRPLTDFQKQEEVKHLQYVDIYYDIEDSDMKVKYEDGTITSLEEAEEYRKKIENEGLILSDNRRYEIEFPKQRFAGKQFQVVIKFQYYPNLLPEIEPPKVIGLWGPFHYPTHIEETLFMLAHHAQQIGEETLYYRIRNIIDYHNPYTRKTFGCITYEEVIERLCDEELYLIQNLIPRMNIMEDSKKDILELLKIWWQDRFQPIHIKPLNTTNANANTNTNTNNKNKLLSVT